MLQDAIESQLSEMGRVKLFFVGVVFLCLIIVVMLVSTITDFYKLMRRLG